MMKIKNKTLFFITVTTFASLLFTSYGYAALNTNLSITGEANFRVDDNVRITDLKLISASDGAYETYNNKFSKNSITVFVTIPSNGSITYEIDVTNKTSDDYYLKKLVAENFSNSAISYNINFEVYDLVDKGSTKKVSLVLRNDNDQVQTTTLDLSYQFEKDTDPTITLINKTWSTWQDDVNPILSYDAGPSGGTTSCSSNKQNGTFTNLSQLQSKGTHTITCTVTSNTKKTASKSMDIDITYDAYSMTNVIVNGSFENGTTSWTSSPAGRGSLSITTSNCKLGSKCGYLTKAASDLNYQVSEGVTLTKDHIYYAMEWVNILNYDNSPTSQFDMYYTKGTSAEYPEYVNINFRNFPQNTWTKADSVFTSGVSAAYYFRAALMYTGAITLNIDGAALIDLTETFGSGNEPDLSWCNKHIDYFDGTTTIYR